jgi:hypothetical protein
MPTPVITNTQLGWATLSTTLSNIKPTSSFLKQLFFGDRTENMTTESVELSYLEGHNKMAPFVELSAEAVPVEGNSNVFANVSCPNIKIKRPMDAYNAFLRRQPGTGIFVSGNEVAVARQAAIVEDQLTMARMVERREEWMVSKMLTGVDSTYLILSYQDSTNLRANFRVRYPRPSGHVVTVSTSWATSTVIKLDFHKAKRKMAQTTRLVPNVVVLGSNAAELFITNTAVLSSLDNRNVSIGNQTMMTQFSEAGAIFLGNYCGIDVWEYSAEYIDEDGTTSVPYIGADQAIFLHTSPSNEAKFLYGAIPDHDAFEQGLFVGQRFSKAWKVPDPSVMTQMLQTRPMPLVRRPGAVYALDVTP